MTAVGYTGGDPNKVDVAGDTMTGPLILSGDPVLPLGAATKQFAESQGGGGGSGTPSNTVVTETAYGQASTAGAVTTYSRGDHTHGTPALPTPGAIGAATTGHNHTGTYDPSGSAASALASALAADVPLGGSTPTAVSITAVGAAGSSSSSSHQDHTHAGPGFGSVAAETSFGITPADGVASSVARSDHTHGTPTAPSVPSASSSVTAETSFGASSNAGAAVTYSRGDHTHGTPAAPSVPSAASTVSAETSYGVSSNAGSVGTFSRGDHTHGTPALTANTPVASAVGDTGAVGTGTTPAKDDHRHAREGFGAVTAQTSFGASSGNGAATTLARSDHTHGTPTQPAETVMFAFSGTAVVTTGVLRWYNRTGRTLTIIGAWVAANTAPTGADMRADVNKNGTTIFTTQGNRPTCAATTNGGVLSTTPDVTSVADGDYVTADIDVIGSTIAGADVTVGVVYR